MFEEPTHFRPINDNTSCFPVIVRTYRLSSFWRSDPIRMTCCFVFCHLFLVSQRTLNVRPGYASALQDVKVLLCRFACNRHFHQETGGGGRESNIQLLPHLMQVCLHSMLMSSSVRKELVELDEFMDVPDTQWATSEQCWSSTGPLYRTVVALHLWSVEVWRQQRGVMLRRLIYLAVGRLKQLGSRDSSESPEAVFLRFKPYFIFFGLVDAIYSHLFKVSHIWDVLLVSRFHILPWFSLHVTFFHLNIFTSPHFVPIVYIASIF